MKFDKDVFISYAHIDDAPLDEGAAGWITDFHILLETRLQQTIGKKIIIWRDQELSGNEFFAKTIESQLPSLKLMVSIITPRYLDSDWCKKELGSFYKAAIENGGISIGDKSRIFKIVKTPVDKDVIENLPEGIHQIFDEILDYKFYIQESTGKFKELSRSSWVDQTVKREFMNKMDDVVQDMANLIKKLNSVTGTNIEKKKIFLAETSYDMQIYRDNLVRELEEANYSVLPNKKLPLVIDRFTSEVSSCLDESILSLHIVSPTNYAVQPEGTDKSIVILQNKIAAEKSSVKDFKRLIWIPPSGGNTNINEETSELQKTFLQDLKTNVDIQKGADILEGPLEEFKQSIFATIKRMDEEEKAKKAPLTMSAATTVAEGEKITKLVYLVCDQRDLEFTRPLEDVFTNNGHGILLPLFEGDLSQMRQAHLDNLKICDAVVIYYGAGNYRWMGSMKSDLLRIPALGREKPLIDKIIYIAGKEDEDKKSFKANDITVINGLGGFNAGLFNGFIQKLK